MSLDSKDYSNNFILAEDGELYPKKMVSLPQFQGKPTDYIIGESKYKELNKQAIKVEVRKVDALSNANEIVDNKVVVDMQARASNNIKEYAKATSFAKTTLEYETGVMKENILKTSFSNDTNELRDLLSLKGVFSGVILPSLLVLVLLWSCSVLKNIESIIPKDLLISNVPLQEFVNSDIWNIFSNLWTVLVIFAIVMYAINRVLRLSKIGIRG